MFIGRFDEFDDLTHHPEAKAFAHRSIAQSDSSKNNLQYEAIDYIFNMTTWIPTRFGTGSFPVWYASTDLKTTFYETFYHWQRNFIQGPQGFSHLKNSIKTQRTVFTVSCKAALIDLREQEDKISHPDPLYYPTTQELGLRIHKEGYPGLLTRSARIKNGENAAVFRKEVLLNPQYYNSYIYEYHGSTSPMTIKDKLGNTIAA